MTTIRLALAQLSSEAGAVQQNAAAIRAAITAAHENAADILITPEQAVSGYPVEDLLGEHAFLDDVERAVRELAEQVPDNLIAVIGAPVRTAALPADSAATHKVDIHLDSADRDVRNAVLIANDGRIVTAHTKSLLPTYGVFDDSRWTAPGALSQDHILVNGINVAFAICEDVWAPDVIVRAAASGAKLILVSNASPYYQGKPNDRVQLLRNLATSNDITIVYVNSVGGQDELVFDGGSLVVAPNGDVLLRAPLFSEGVFYLDIDLDGGYAGIAETGIIELPKRDERPTIETPLATWPDGDAETYQALVTGFRDYVTRAGFHEVIIGLSGGLDSALAAVIAADALGPDALFGVGMPGPYSSEGSVSDARLLADNLGIRFTVLPIKDTYEAERAILGDLLDGPGVDVATENIQARLRALHLMTLANARNAMMVNTGNKSEASVGYFTLGGDSSGGYAVLKDVYKTVAYRLAEWRNAEAVRLGQAPPIPSDTITKPPSAELAPDQVDTNSLPPYPILDAILQAYLERLDSAQTIADTLVAQHGLDRETAEATTLRVLRMTDRAEHKRRQVAPGLKVTRRAFGRDRRVPIINGRTHHLQTEPALA